MGSTRRQARVLFVNDTARNGGPGRSLHSILKFLDPAAVHRCVVLPRPGPIAELLAREAVADEMRFEPGLIENPIEPWSRPMQRSDYRAPTGVRSVRAIGNAGRVIAALGRLTRVVRRERFDLVYCNGTNADFAGAVVARAAGIPALWHVRYTSLPRVARRLHRAFSASRPVRRILCVSNVAARLFPHCQEKVKVIHNALDVDAFDPVRVVGALRTELGLPEDAIVFGSHGRVLRRKGYLEMIEAAGLALGAMSPSLRERVFFAVVGDTPQDFPDDHVADCELSIARAGLRGRFRMLGFRTDVRALVADFDVAVVPSVYEDPLPRAVMESMALAKPVVAFGVGGIDEMVRHEVSGTIVPFARDAAGTGASPAAVERFALALLAYAADADRRTRHGLAARAHAVASFDARAHARAVEGEIRAACGMEPR